ncbi:hypothetical protein QSV08_15325 [Maribacter sp. BPC-D8]|uniref:hypothetical protein n=1 Tax=Maribacter sp. BPC-D8 TaxID=3053613 RepID=UPI002B45D5A0|nr:hypothetical protein [Maribacter sp. BPC-D8]WRI28586.1 hypothetical protein QSV08_15325 [Maribacter sp. BPC-D8]
MKTKIIIGLNIVALIISVIWLINSNYDFEPIILCVTLMATLLGLTIKDKIMGKNDAKIKGDENEVKQGTKKTKSTDNKTVIKGNKNKVQQK